MPNVHLVPLTEADYADYMARSVADYAADNVKAGYWTSAEAQQRAQSVFDRLLPQGVHTPEQHLYSIRDAESGVQVGVIWLHENRKQVLGFIYDFVISEQFRRQGYGTAALLALEDVARQMGLTKLNLHVFGHNTPAKALYEKVGYVVTSFNMGKAIT
jgi:RimJ/RimL family protein N-acetyltransferase